MYILDNNNLYHIENDNKGKIFGSYINGKVKII
jgi:hypothetical protein